MSLESFYGGRQGVSFVIVKHFDGVDIPQPNKDGNYTYRGNYYAVDSVGRLILKDNQPITVDGNNQNIYSWNYFLHNNEEISTSIGGIYKFDVEYAEGMVQCFSQGASTTNEVNYGEYVIIDTIANLNNKSSVDNGKVFRRGMNSQTGLGGAEYIGQIVGPQGETPELGMVSYYDIINREPHKESVLNPANEALVPGAKINDQGEMEFEEGIKYAYATMKDVHGNVIGCELGFVIPTLIQDFIAYSISPYENRVPGTAGTDSQYTNLLFEDPEQYINNKWIHPFYQKWHFKIPQGYHGADSTNIEIIPTETKPAYSVNGETYAGAAIYSDPELTTQIGVSAAPLIIMRGNKYNADPSVAYAIVIYNNQECYVNKDDCYKYVIRYKETNYDVVKEGIVKYHEIGAYNSIEKITMSENGVMTVFYTGAGPKALEPAVRWIENENTKGITIDKDGSVHIYFNTLDADGNYEHYDYPTVLDWVQSVTLTQDGKFKVLFNNDSLPDLPVDSISGKSKYETTLNWIDYINIEDDGTIKFYFNSDHDIPAYTFQKRVKSIKNISFNSTSGAADALEGSGNQKFVVTYNTGDIEDNSSWAAMNYIIEARVYVPMAGFGDSAVAYHLIAIFSDPEYRKKFTNKYSYPSEKLGVVYDEWVDLGYVRGEKGGFHTVAQLSGSNRLKDDNGTYIPPEAIKYAEEERAAARPYIYDGVTGIDWQYAGWGVLVEETSGTTTVEAIYFYDYSEAKWYRVGKIDINLLSADNFIMQGNANVELKPAGTDTLGDSGFWFETEKILFAE